MCNEQDLQQLKDNFDVRQYLDGIGVDYRRAGEENVGEGWIGLDCVFCGIGLGHLGVRYERGSGFTCWNCGEDGDAIDLIKALEGVGFNAARERLEQYQGFVAEKREEREPVRTHTDVLPEGFELIEAGDEPLPVKRWFARRGFDLRLCQEHGLGWVPYGDYQLRLIVPVRLDGVVVSFQAIDMTGQARVIYLDCPRDRAVVYNKHLLYGLDGVGDQVVLVEGVTDKWRMGSDAVAMFGKNWSLKQLILLHDRARGKRLKVLLDMDAMREGRKLYCRLCELFDLVTLWDEYGVKDPAELGREEVEGILMY